MFTVISDNLDKVMFRPTPEVFSPTYTNSYLNCIITEDNLFVLVSTTFRPSFYHFIPLSIYLTLRRFVVL